MFMPDRIAYRSSNVTLKHVKTALVRYRLGCRANTIRTSEPFQRGQGIPTHNDASTAILDAHVPSLVHVPLLAIAARKNSKQTNVKEKERNENRKEVSYSTVFE
ncbi:hypothetical protein KIN20_017270 [Parelaphostrongylus tenuis]|uniref:Uncharacterized protein n=1 Tax=Parelaphostrongylus tenuis TaxID=148309 RepID=A0AAD5N0M2_PARTN|nr:hypothetical protein KIN20_017270 [Parelaphostrongylus tenuis]